MRIAANLIVAFRASGGGDLFFEEYERFTRRACDEGITAETVVALVSLAATLADHAEAMGADPLNVFKLQEEALHKLLDEEPETP
jgi:hypothetical protein